MAESNPQAGGKAEALREILSPNPKTRRSALLLLGKFDDSISMGAIINALGDKDPTVRHTALTAISEYLMVGSSKIILVMKQENQKTNNRTISDVFKMIADVDVDNRRLASQLAVTIGRSMGFRPEFLPEVVKKTIVKMYQDSDEIVRFNMYSNYLSLRKITPKTILLKGVEDTNNQVKKEALGKLVHYERILAMKHLASLLDTPDESSRIFVMSNFYYSTTSKSVARVFKKLVKDPNPVVAAYAVYGLILIKQYPTETALDQILEKINEVDQKLGDKIINSVGRLPQFKAWVSEKYKLKAYPFNRAILASYIQQHRREVSIEQLLVWFNQSDANISRTASNILSGKKVKLEQLLPLVDSEYVHTRRGLISMSYRLKREARAELLSSLLLDDDQNVQYQALRVYASMRFEDYLVYAAAALTEVSSPRLLATALRIFLKDKVKLTEMLKADVEFKDIFKKALQAYPAMKVPMDIKRLLVEEVK